MTVLRGDSDTPRHYMRIYAGYIPQGDEGNKLRGNSNCKAIQIARQLRKCSAHIRRGLDCRAGARNDGSARCVALKAAYETSIAPRNDDWITSSSKPKNRSVKLRFLCFYKMVGQQAGINLSPSVSCPERAYG